MKNSIARKIIAAAMAAGIAISGGCQGGFDESGLADTFHTGSGEGSVQSTHSDPEKTEQSTVQTVSGSEIALETVSERSVLTASETNSTESTEDSDMETNEIYIKVGENELTAILEDNESAVALKELISGKTLTISASNYGGFEKVCTLGTSLPRNDVQTTTSAGDICLYNGNSIVIFYGSNSWSYTKLGKISGANSSELKEILSGPETEITLSTKPFE